MAVLFLAAILSVVTSTQLSTADELNAACRFKIEGLDFDLTSLDKVNPESQYEVENIHWKFCSHLWFAQSFAYVDKPSLFTNQGFKLITSSDFEPTEVSLVLKDDRVEFTGGLEAIEGI